MMKELISRLSTESTITHAAIYQSGKIVAVFGVSPSKQQPNQASQEKAH
jgi:hypothetical protein